MKKHFYLFVLAFISLSMSTRAQYCATDGIYREAVKRNPQILEQQQKLETDIRNQIAKMDLNKLSKTTDGDTIVYYIPVVVHVMHDYNTADYVTDNSIYAMINHINVFYRKQNADLANVIPTFVPYVGKVNIQFILATKDPTGNPTKGITRRRTYLTYGGDEFVKMDLWAPDAYLNIWIENVIGRGTDGGVGVVAAYATYPSSAATNPYSDGVMTAAPYINSADHTIEHEIGHYFNLIHTWGSGVVETDCTGSDGVDDTPPTKGHFVINPCPLYDTACAHGYVANGVDYPDTVNTQNVMDYSNCTNMFTKGQVVRMRAALQSAVGNRNHLITVQNAASTGIFAATPDLKPVPDFSINRTSSTATDKKPFDKVYGCADNATSFTFTDKSWNDTIITSGIKFSFSNAPSNTNVSANGGSSISTAFGQPGWVTVTQQATGNNSGTATATSSNRLYVADPAPVNTSGGTYFQEFNTADTAKWPMFNYYNNNWKWEIVNNAGYYDNYSIRYKNYDTRTNTAVFTGYPTGDMDDFFSPVFDLTDPIYSTNCNLNFVFTGATKSAMYDDMNDTLQIFYSTTCGNNWNRLEQMSKNELVNKGTFTTEYTPAGMWDWVLKSIALPAAAKQSKVMFRFRYRPHNGANTVMGSGNNFYMDRIHISSFPTGITEEQIKKQGMVIVPNPTQQGAKLVVNGVSGNADVVITDITGKVVYRTSAILNGNISTITIPAENLSVKGMYLVQLISGNQTETEKLIVY